jgi:hypothetical protein
MQKFLGIPDQFGSYASFPTATDIPDSSVDSFLGLQYTVGANTYYGFARFAGGDLEVMGSRQRRTRTSMQISRPGRSPKLSTWAMMGLGFVGTTLLAACRRQSSLRLA